MWAAEERYSHEAIAHADAIKPSRISSGEYTDLRAVADSSGKVRLLHRASITSHARIVRTDGILAVMSRSRFKSGQS